MIHNKYSAENITFTIFKFLVITGLLMITLYPFWNTLVISFNSADDTIRGGITFWPRVWSLTNYRAVWVSSNIPQAFMISVLRTGLSVIFNLLFTTMLAYSLSRKEFSFRKPLTAIVVLSMYVSAGLFPNYFLIRSLGLLNTFWVYVIPSMFAAFNFVVIRTFIRGIPESLVESARMDGTSEYLIFLRIIVPLSAPVLATVGLFVAVGAWNSWFDTVLYTSQSPELFTLQYQLMATLQSSMNQSRSAADVGANGMAANIASSMVTPVSVRAATTIFAAVPILLVYPFVQKYFVVGMNLGSVKE